MMVKKDGGKMISKPTRHCMTSFCIYTSLSGWICLLRDLVEECTYHDDCQSHIL
jgi:hypothetical protein